MNGTAARWIVSGVLAAVAATILVVKKKKKPEQRTDPAHNENAVHLTKLKKSIIEEAIWCGLQVEIPGWKQEDIPDREKVEELSKLATPGWGNIVISIVKKLSEEDQKGTGSETSG